MVNSHSYPFRCEDGEGKFIELHLSFSEPEHLITLSCTYNYHKYLFTEETSSVIHFKYYKTCLMNNAIDCKVSEDNITLVVKECSDIGSSVKFILNKQERDADEKLNTMLEVMMKDIAQLKGMLWFTDRDLNKFSEKYITNWNSVFIRVNGSPILGKIFTNTYSKKEFYVNTTGCKIKKDSINSPLFKSYRESDLEPIIIYFKQKVDFSRIEISVSVHQSNNQDLVKVYVFGVMKPQGVIRKFDIELINENLSSHYQEPKEDWFIMPKLEKISEQECKLNGLVSIHFDSNNAYDGIGIAVRNQRNDMFNYTIPLLRIY
ncbi:predicted protein [Naegleria gruberi]|uniref:Predicted protein n=1 Tax=Naegleria gruberi TaxID=5762 RepID=D2V7N1_NAEGR|nr:uncharacterized protein NAEGRDRAFT_64865 [Naegleria gruberi]EFC47280.1 predicted protein [Naegleria gruberi]|eukprot:XP_002680024.1 predicted protein [Naegleria gruberi strain NEG-M]